MEILLIEFYCIFDKDEHTTYEQTILEIENITPKGSFSFQLLPYHVLSIGYCYILHTVANHLLLQEIKVQQNM